MGMLCCGREELSTTHMHGLVHASLANFMFL